jgi:methyltransferase-like protein/SAM-dependent methyltransferase
MQPAPVDQCRVLELGCASGGNLIPMAYGLPGSEFVGIDYSARQIAKGQATVAALGLKNITLKELNILDVKPEFGQFDYIIAHGVYSWVPTEVQDKVFQICRRNLAPNGVAYVSYNTYPGWHMLSIARDIMLYHTREVAEPGERAAQARSLISFMADSVPNRRNAYGAFLQAYSIFLSEQRETSKSRDDSFMLHDEMEEVNDPVYFYKFMERAANHGLQYLAEAQYHKTQPNDFPPQVVEALSQLAQDRIAFEQYLDFMRNQSFRQTLLCHQGIQLSRKLKLDRMSSFYVASRAQPVASEPDIRSVSVEEFRGPNGTGLSTDHPVSKAAMLYLGQTWPTALPFDMLLTTARAKLGLDSALDSLALDAHTLATNLLTAYSYSDSLVELHVHIPAFTLEISERPVGSPLACLLAHERTTVTNLRHERVSLDAFSRYLLCHLDGCHDRFALLDRFMAGPVAEGTLMLEEDGQPLTDTSKLKALLAEELETHLSWLAHAALLVS